MKISRYLIGFVCLFVVFPIFAIGKRKFEKILGPIAKIGRVVNETGANVTMDVIYKDSDWGEAIQILPGDHVLNKEIPLSADPNYDLVLFGYELPEDQEPTEQLFVRIARTVELIAHYNYVNTSVTLGIVDWSAEPEPTRQPLLTADQVLRIPEHQLDNYIIDITLRGQNFADSRIESRSYITPE